MTPMTVLRVLILEDRPSDAELIAYELKRAGYDLDWRRVDTRSAYLRALRPELDLVIADYALPQFDALTALHLLKERKLDIPFIVVTGSISEEVAVEIMRQGAADYLLKDRLARLGQAVVNALQQKREHDQRLAAQSALRASEERFRLLAENAPDLIYRFRYLPSPQFEYVSPAVRAVTGYSPEECYANPNLFYDIVLPADRALLKDAALADEENRPFVLRWVRKDGKVIWAERHNVLIRDELGMVHAVEGSVRDVTERIQRQLELEAIASVSAALRTAPDRANLVQAILNQVSLLLQANGTAMFLKESNGSALVCATANGRLTHTQGLTLAPGQGIPWQTLQSGQLFMTQTYASDPYDLRTLLIEGDSPPGNRPGHRSVPKGGNMQAMACTPLMTQDQEIGVLVIERTLPIDEQEGRLLTMIANIAANAIQRTTLHEAWHRNARQMAAVSEVGRVLSEKLEVPVIFKRLDHYLYELLPGITVIFISFYDAELRQFTCQFASIEGEPQDVSNFPPAPLEPPGIGTQSEVVYTRRPQIFNDLQGRLVRIRGGVTMVGASGPLSQSGLYAPMLGRDQVVGVLQVQADKPNHFTAEDAEVISLVANTAAVAIENARLLEDLQQSNLELLQAYDATLEGWTRALDLRDRETEGHTKRVAQAAAGLARSLGLSGEDLMNFQRGALLHDIGKMGIPDGILLKPGPLTADEMEIMRRHPQYAHDLLQPTEYLRPALQIPYCHHEKWDGTGYPRGLKGEEIPLEARIFAVIDVGDALRSDRPYRPAWSEEDALEYIRMQSGLHFDPAIVEAFFKMMGKE